MNKEANQNGGGFFKNARRELAWTFGVSVLLLAIFECVFAYNPRAPYWWGLDIRLPLIAFAALALWLILIWFLDFQTSGSFFKDYRWIVSPAIVLVVFLLGVSWSQAKLAEETLVQYAVSPFDADGGSKVSIRYPKNIPVENTSQLEISIWSDKDWSGCASPITLEISSDDRALLFAIPPESDNPPEWKDSIRVVLKKDAPEAALLVQAKETPGESAVFSGLSVKVNDAEGKPGGEVTIESAREAQVRGWKGNFLGNGSIIISLAGAALAWFKQNDDEKKKEQKQKTKEFISSFQDKAKKDLPGTLDELHTLLLESGWGDSLQRELKDKLDKFLRQEIWQSLSALQAEDILKVSKLFPTIWKKVFGGKSSDKLDVLKKIRDAKSFEDLEKCARSHPEALAVLNTLANSRYGQFITLSNERPPRDEQIRFRARPAEAVSPKLKAWLEAHDLSESPFSDADASFMLRTGGRQMLIEAALPFKFSENETFYEQSSLVFKSRWDAEAGMFEYLKSMSAGRAARAFVALASPQFIQAEDNPRRLLLQALAEAWLFEFAESALSFYALRESQRALIGKLLLWRHGSADAAVVHMEAALEGKLRASKEKSGDEPAEEAEEKEESGDKPAEEKEKSGNKSTEEERNQALLQSISAWLKNSSSGALKDGGMRAIFQIRPPAKGFTLFINFADCLKSAPLELTRDPGWKFVDIRISEQDGILAEENKLVEMCRKRVEVCSKGQKSSLQELFAPYDDPRSVEVILAQKAKGSPGEMVRLGQELLLRHVETHSIYDDLQIDDLNALA